MKRQRITPGAIVKIKFDEKNHTYGRLLIRPYIEIYDCKTTEDIGDLEEIIARPVLFTSCVYDYAVTKGRWEIVGKLPFKENYIEVPLQFMQDPVDKNRCRLIDANGKITPATLEQCRGLERSAVWEPEHVEERLQDHYAGRPNKWVESLKLKE